ncbi:unnamed protein product [Calypogeia fissa]
MTSQLGDTLLPTSSARETEPLVPKPVVRSSDTGSSVAAASSSTEKNPWDTLVNGLYSGASNLANLLPTGTFLAFTAIAPIITDNGVCDDPFEFWITVAVLIFFALFCVFSCFTDSYQAADGKVYYGLVTCNGLWTPQLPVALHPGDKEEYKLTWIDVMHSVLSLAVFAACALMTSNIRNCFYPKIDHNVMTIVPAVVGFFVSAVFVTFPSKRHGVGFPVSPASFSYASRSFAYQRKRQMQAEPEASKGVAATGSPMVGSKKV